MKPESDFWRAVRELAAMRVHIPEERRRSGNAHQHAAKLRTYRCLFWICSDMSQPDDRGAWVLFRSERAGSLIVIAEGYGALPAVRR